MIQLHPAIKKILEQPENPSAVPVEKQAPEEARTEWKADMLAVDAPAPALARVWDFSVPGPTGEIPCRGYRMTENSVNEPLLIYFHGGGFIRGDLDTHDSICRVLAKETPCVVISADYRLAPEHRFPAGVEDAFAVLKYAAANSDALGIDSARIAVGGDSAGGNLAAACSILARGRHEPPICFQLLIYPVTDLVNISESKRLFSKGYLLNSMPFYIDSYLGPKGDGESQFASPLLSPDLTNLPPAFVLTAGYDPLRDEGKAYARRLAESGVAVEEECYDDMIHGFVSLRGLLKEADGALALCARRLRSAFAN
ncbi:alpha/beta hydrolase [Mesorhizobium sp. CO1-1-8]|uniref:alpha/beta hydrolase n=1 Tax=Mesorhizobium sp. CO1-1-8 TaxID=2876631 RepID=UPI001CD0D38F|nr:alpha/beta hydrolase [Mesorhizobium sp. CO1-1-8]MBZ9772441.1 alpha/beta hydrolase [Mesorhizobium sp. CO1-1-8]